MSADPVPAPASLQEASRISILDPARLSFSWEGSQLRLTMAEHACWMRVNIQRCFPLRRPRSHYSVRDQAQKEIGLIIDPALLDAASQQAIEQDLRRRYLITEITRVQAVRDRFGVLEWEVETSRGAVSFITRDLRDHAFRAAPNHWILADVEGRRYQISDIDALDRHSAALVALHL
jgi:hypothetical protein